MQAQDVMSRTVITVRPHMPVEAAAALLLSHGVTSAPVVTAEGVLRGMVSEVDLLRAQPVPDALTTTPECRAHGSRRHDTPAGHGAAYRRAGRCRGRSTRPRCPRGARRRGRTAGRHHQPPRHPELRRTAATDDRARRQACRGDSVLASRGSHRRPRLPARYRLSRCRSSVA